MKNLVLSIFTFCAGFAGASHAQVSQINVGQSTLQIDALLGAQDGLKKYFISTFEAVRRTEEAQVLGQTPPCSAENLMFGFASAVGSDLINLALSAGTLIGDFDLEAQAKNFRKLADVARESSCVEKNNQCCQKSNQADVSDKCLYNLNKNCTLTGVRIQGCTESSDDC